MIDVFDVGPGGMLSGAPVMNPSATPVPFAFAFGPMGELVVVEAGASTVSTYAINPDDSLTTIGSAPDGQAAACWISAARGFYFVSNAGSANVSTYALDAAGVPAWSARRRRPLPARSTRWPRATGASSTWSAAALVRSLRIASATTAASP